MPIKLGLIVHCISNSEMLKCEKKKKKKKCLLGVIKCGIEKDIASDLRKDCLEQNLDRKVINSPSEKYLACLIKYLSDFLISSNEIKSPFWGVRLSHTAGTSDS